MKTSLKRIEPRNQAAPAGATTSKAPPAGNGASASIGRSNVCLTHTDLEPINQTLTSLV